MATTGVVDEELEALGKKTSEEAVEISVKTQQVGNCMHKLSYGYTCQMSPYC